MWPFAKKLNNPESSSYTTTIETRVEPEPSDILQGLRALAANVDGWSLDLYGVRHSCGIYIGERGEFQHTHEQNEDSTAVDGETEQYEAIHDQIFRSICEREARKPVLSVKEVET